MAAPGLSPVLKTQPQNAQLEIIFRGPLVKNSQVLSLDDLIALDIRYNYKHKIVWVEEIESNYFLVDGDGSQLSHWKKHATRLILDAYNPLVPYQTGDTIYLAGKIYKAKEELVPGISPLNNLDKWEVIVGEIVTQRYIFKDQSTLIFYTEIRNPMFTIVTGTIETNEDDDYIIGDDGMINIINPVYVDGYIIRRSDLPNNMGKAYELSFEEDSEPVLLTGAINVK